jgi:hypothetical protein
VLGSTRDATNCHRIGGQSRCVARFPALEAEQPKPSVWTVSVAKSSSPPAAILVTVTFAPR